MKPYLQITKDILPKVIIPLTKPEKPQPNSCCGCGCGESCVWVPYYKDMKEYEEILLSESEQKVNKEFKEQKNNIKNDC